MNTNTLTLEGLCIENRASIITSLEKKENNSQTKLFFGPHLTQHIFVEHEMKLNRELHAGFVKIKYYYNLHTGRGIILLQGSQSNSYNLNLDNETCKYLQQKFPELEVEKLNN